MEVKMPNEKDGPFGTRHDPGPWRWSRTYGIGDGTYWCLENDESAAEGKTIDASIILRLCSDNWLGEPFLNNPNARLIAAAPDLLEALKKANQFITNGIELGYIQMPDPETPDSAHDTPGIIRDAIAKAKGES
jgi:hypothetical protein